jgi:Zn-dependent oligopeptidase
MQRYWKLRHPKPSGHVLTAIALLLIVGATPRMAAADEKVPRLNVEPSCRFQASMQSDKQVGYEKCMEQEDGAKAQLEKTWAQYTLEDRAHCLDMTNELGGNTASYVEVLECVTLTKDARAYEKKFPSDMDISIGQGQGR